MMQGLIFFASYGYFEGGAIGNLLNMWEQAGIFSYLIPFLLIFALVFGILTRLNIFTKDTATGKTSNKAINGIIALAVALMALQFPMVPIFFSELFPRLGIALSIILGLLVITGLFMDPKNKGWMIGLMVVSVIIVVAVLISSTWELGFGLGSWWNYNWPTLVGILIFLGLIIAIVASANPMKQTPAVDSPLAQSLRSAMTGR